MEITKVGVIGAGAIGAYFLWGMRELPREDICLIVKGERKERLIRNGIIINGERYDYPVKEPQEVSLQRRPVNVLLNQILSRKCGINMQLIYQEIYHRLYLELVLAHMTTANMWNLSLIDYGMRSIP